MAKFNPEPCTVVKITGPVVNVSTKEGKIICRNKSFFKKIPRPLRDDDEEEEETCNNRSNLEHNDIQEDATTPQEVGTTSGNITEVENEDLRRSTRIRNHPERYGIQIPSKFITDTS